MGCEFYSEKRKIFTPWCNFCYRIKWNVPMIANSFNSNGFIVQHFSRTSIPANTLINDEKYYEAWKVENGICIDTNSQGYDDEFAIGNINSICSDFKKSLEIGMGKYILSGNVFWIDKNSQNNLYNVVNSWSTTEVTCSGGLRATVYSNEMDKLIPLFQRETLCHGWELKTKEQIVSAAKYAVKEICSTNDEEYFESFVYNLLPDADKYISELKVYWKEMIKSKS